MSHIGPQSSTSPSTSSGLVSGFLKIYILKRDLGRARRYYLKKRMKLSTNDHERHYNSNDKVI